MQSKVTLSSPKLTISEPFGEYQKSSHLAARTGSFAVAEMAVPAPLNSALSP